MKITKIETWLCDTPVSHPIDLGRFVVRQRSYLAVRVHTSEGLVADCVTQSRGAPLDVIVNEVFAPRMLGKDAQNLAALRQDIERQLTALEMYGANGRAWSALEICLQGLRAQACGWPLWRLLGGAPRSVPIQIVEGYAIQGEPEEGFVDRLVQRVDEGFGLLKVEAGHYTDDADLLRHIEQFRKRVGPEPKLVLDMAWGWSKFKPRLRTLEALQDLGIAWIEDPFASSQVESYRQLRQASPVTIGGGDETSRPENMYALLENNALDLIRIDATTMGGIENARALSVEAARRNIEVAYHVHPEVHEHLVFGLGIAGHLELFATDREFDRLHDLVKGVTYDRVRKGHLEPSEEPGTGLVLDLEKMAPFIKRHLSASAD